MNPTRHPRLVSERSFKVCYYYYSGTFLFPLAVLFFFHLYFFFFWRGHIFVIYLPFLFTPPAPPRLQLSTGKEQIATYLHKQNIYVMLENLRAKEIKHVAEGGKKIMLLLEGTTFWQVISLRLSFHKGFKTTAIENFIQTAKFNKAYFDLKNKSALGKMFYANSFSEKPLQYRTFTACDLRCFRYYCNTQRSCFLFWLFC